MSDNRLQNVVITLDKVKLCLSKPGQCLNAPLRLLTDSEVVEYLWTGVLREYTCVFNQMCASEIQHATSADEQPDKAW